MDTINVLHIEDDAGDAFLLKTYLSNIQKDFKKYIVTQSSNIKDSLKILNTRTNLNVILLDINLPDGNGIHNISEIRKLSSNTPIIIITSIHDEELAMQALELGAQECITKSSLNSDVLSRIIKSSILRHKNQMLLSKKAYFDDLTGLPNRQNFENSARALIAHAHRWQKRDALMFIDLNKFKFINDTFGHQAGNIVLAELANRLKNVLRDSDLIARYAGDEFVIYLNCGNSHVTEDLCINIAKKITTLVERPIDIGKQEIEISLSIGISIFPDAGETFDLLLKNADEAMYDAKKNNDTNYKIISNNVKQDEPLESSAKNVNNNSSILVISSQNIFGKIDNLSIYDYNFSNTKCEHGAFKYLENHTPLCILYDDTSLNSDALAFLKKFKYSDHYHHIPILVLAHKGSIEEAIECMHYGASDYINSNNLNLNFLNEKIQKSIKNKYEYKALYNRNKDLEKINSENSEFSQTVAHDLKSPMRKISMFCDLLKSETYIQKDKEINSYITRMSVNIKRTNNLIEDLLKYASIGQNEEKREMTELQALTQEIIKDLSSWLKEKEATIHIDTMPIWPVYKSTMHQLLINLIMNAVKYTKPNEKPVLYISAEISNNNCIILIKDNGRGISSKQIPQIFKPFHRLHSADEIEGTGLGLSICNKIAKKHNGHIYVESVEGKGSIFYTSLPNS